MGSSLNHPISLLITAAILFLVVAGCDYFTTVIKTEPDSKTTFNGRLIDSLTGKGISGITVEFLGQTEKGTTDSTGYFSLQSIRTGNSQISFYKEGFAGRTFPAQVKLNSDSLFLFKIQDLRPRLYFYSVPDFTINAHANIIFKFNDPDSNLNLLLFDWGDGSKIDSFPDIYQSDSIQDVKGHTYQNFGFYKLKVIAKDAGGQYSVSTIPITVSRLLKPVFGSVYIEPNPLIPGIADSLLYILINITEANQYIKFVQITYNIVDYLQRDTTVTTHTAFLVKPQDPPLLDFPGISRGTIGINGVQFRYAIPTQNLP
ncbi:MAG: carboxypeptidase regulatory-like domain-containing protein, partial [Fibrobacteres bacterium]|nr:carboxypeptidase regulatory-like domain-containing protein [Fibrobacterota bacterium]